MSVKNFNLKSFILTIAAILSLSQAAIAGQQLGRQRINFDDNWSFALSSSKADEVGSVKPWREVALPHDWSRECEYSKEYNSVNGSLPGGYGYYTKEFMADENMRNRCVEIEFGGIYQHATIYLNGKRVGTQYDGYVSFNMDLTPYLKLGEKNQLLVEVDNTRQPNCRWYSGSGIYRHVWLNITDKLHIANWGTYITTPEVSDERASVVIESTIVNRGEVQPFTLRTTIYDAEQREVASYQTEELSAADCSYDIRHHLEVESPERWSPERPYLYNIVSEVVHEGAVVDSYTSTFGIRTLQFDSERGFFLNGENMKFKGVCLHHDGGAFGAAVPIEIWRQRLSSLKEIGCNAIRTAHNPAASEFLDLCDSMGFMVMAEFCDKWDLYFDEKWYCAKYIDPYFRTEWRQNFTNIIKRDRNHPSIVFWSVGNETNAPGDEECNRLLDEYCSFTRKMDPTRAVIAGMERGGDTKDPDQKARQLICSGKYMDVLAGNYCEQWLTRIKRLGLTQPFISTESYTYFNSEETFRHAKLERLPWLDVVDNDFNMGLFVWAGIEYLGEAKWPSSGSDRALLDRNGRLKEVAHLYKALWREEPTVHIVSYVHDAHDFSYHSRNWGEPLIEEAWQGEPSDTIDLATYTSCEEVELYLNGRKIGTQRLEDFPNKIMKWDNIPYEAGELRAVGRRGGKQVCEFTLNSAGKAAALQLCELKQQVPFDAGDYIFVDMNVVDNKGINVYHAEPHVHFSIEGAGTIVALSSGSTTDLKPMTDIENCTPYKGRIRCVVRRIGEGSIKITAEANGLKKSKLTIK